MSKNSPKNRRDGAGSTAKALTMLADTILALLEEGSLDAQFAEKLCRRIGRQADESGLSDTQAPEDLGLTLKLQELDTAITQTRANGLVAAMENLRRADTHDRA